MKTKLTRELIHALLLFLWLILVQGICALFTLAVSSLALILMALGGSLVLGGSTSLWGWMALAAPFCLFWLAMGRYAPRTLRPGPAGTAAVLTAWAALTALMRNAYLLLLPQRACGGMLEQLLCALDRGALFDKGRALTAGCFLLPAMLGLGLFLGRGRSGAAVREG